MADTRPLVVFVDNHDSFTFNLVDEFARRGCAVEVWRNGVAAEHVPTRHHALCAHLQFGELRQPSRCRDHDLGVEREHLVGLGVGVVADFDAEPVEFADPPVDDPDEVAPRCKLVVLFNGTGAG